MMSSYNSLKDKHLATNLYNIDGSNNISCELMAYSVVLDLISDLLDNIYNEIFVSTATDFGLTNREKFLLEDNLSQTTTQNRREIIKQKMLVKSDKFTLSDFEELLSGFGVDFFIYELPIRHYMVVDVDFTGVDSTTKRQFIRAVRDIAPAYTEVELVYSGRYWSDIDSDNKTFDTFDNEDNSWVDLDNL